MKLENLNLTELSKEESRIVEGGSDLIENPDGTMTYTGGNGLVYAVVGLYNLYKYVSNAL